MVSEHPEPAARQGGGLAAYVRGRRPTAAGLEQARGRAITDLLPEHLALLVVGINPSLWSAAVDAHYARPGNRFWPALHRAGLARHVIDVSCGMRTEDRALVEDRGIGMTNLVPRATARADELDPEELRAGVERLAALVDERHPRVVAFAGISTYRIAFGVKQVHRGRQPEPWYGAIVHVVPNPSGLNAHDDVDSIGLALRAAAADAWLVPPMGGHWG
ncbi:mismatch-specific DNA-glycosylase [Arsenicicoccus dermatophilus]|uniref:mismatch-specific DNA-glycosylase n=1 Tax=Arsenicicoccus dermatophilus TaxID=1076331 RepID=UPI001F4D1A37|nr:mismatch-specific DNA-glycosylase [Arsenicicoccus dermatophilus]MCH8612918.1 mismatch-specific DNA-glycosylase [Arsenicicoccus dermatophilus]